MEIKNDVIRKLTGEPEAEAKEEVEAAEEEEEAPKETEMEYVSKEEFSSAIDEIKAMIDELAPKKEEVEASEVVETEMAGMCYHYIFSCTLLCSHNRSGSFQ